MSSAAPRRIAWIVSPIYDSLFFIGTPLLCLAAFLPLKGTWASLDIYLAVMAFSSFGHHLPGFFRSYGDAELFRTYRTRFLLAPLLLFAVFVWFGLRELNGMLLILMLWSIWHVMMQHFGFMRIYDAKVGSTAPETALFDRAISLLWFVSIVLWSPQYTHNLFDAFYRSGGFLVPAPAFQALQYGVWGTTVLATLLYAASTILRIRRGLPVSYLKLVLLVVTIAFLYFVWVGLQDILLGLAVWEVFHDIQYFAITWIYNRRLVEKGAGNTRFMNYLFRRRLPMVLMYVGAILAYGTTGWWITTGSDASIRTVMVALVYTSTILHYYYDGFIWKVRQRRTQEGLDLEPGAVIAPSKFSRVFWTLPRGARSALAQSLGFAIPIASLAALEMSRPERSQVEIRESIRDLAPTAIESHLNLGRAYADAGRARESVASYEAALEIDPLDARAHGDFATALLELFGEERSSQAEERLLRALELDPANTKYGVNLALLRYRQRRTEEALVQIEETIERDPSWRPSLPDEFLLIGLSHLKRDELDEALQDFGRVLQHDPGHRDALDALTFCARAKGRSDIAERAIARARAQEPERQDLRVYEIVHLLMEERTSEAVPLLESLIEDHPDDFDRKLVLAEIRATNPDTALRNGEQALRLAQSVVEHTQGRNVGALDILAAAYAETGDFARAMETGQRAIELARREGREESTAAIQARLELYSQKLPYRFGR